jgi:hypothetical protein
LVDVRDAQVVFSDDARTASDILIARQLEIRHLDGTIGAACESIVDNGR